MSFCHLPCLPHSLFVIHPSHLLITRVLSSASIFPLCSSLSSSHRSQCYKFIPITCSRTITANHITIIDTITINSRTSPSPRSKQHQCKHSNVYDTITPCHHCPLPSLPTHSSPPSPPPPQSPPLRLPHRGGRLSDILIHIFWFLALNKENIEQKRGKQRKCALCPEKTRIRTHTHTYTHNKQQL